MEKDIKDMRDGDIFHWRYVKEPENHTNAYWCKSRIAVCRNGKLYDTFWTSPDYVLGIEDKAFTFIANFDELDRIEEYQAEYYDRADIVNLNHSNSSRNNIYLRKGAKKSAARMMAELEETLRDEERKERWAKEKQARVKLEMAKLKSGLIDEVWL